MGFYSTGTINFNAFNGTTGVSFLLSNVLVERCYLTNIYFYGGGVNANLISNDTIRNCFIGGDVTFGGSNYAITYGNVFFHNNFFNGGSMNGAGANCGNVFVELNRPWR